MKLEINHYPITFEEGYEITMCGKVWSNKRNKYLKLSVNNNGYLQCSLNQRHYHIHVLLAKVFIINTENLPTVDHIDGEKLNNNLSNLRWFSRTNQNYNKRKQRNSASQFKGVTLCKNKWRARYTVNNKQIYIGYFEDELEAYRAVLRKIIEHGIVQSVHITNDIQQYL